MDKRAATLAAPFLSACLALRKAHLPRSLLSNGTSSYAALLKTVAEPFRAIRARPFSDLVRCTRILRCCAIVMTSVLLGDVQ